MKNAFLVLTFCMLEVISFTGNAQVENSVQDVNKDDLGEVSDAFQEHFFEALKQKAIENYEKALIELKECQKLQPDKAVVYFEMGKNYSKLKKPEEAISNFQKANRLGPHRTWTLIELMQAYEANTQYDEAILIAKELVNFDDTYNNYLAKLYFDSRQYDQLLGLLDNLDTELGISEYRNSLRQNIYAITNNKSAEIKTIQQAIEVAPENERNYLKLIFLYSEQGMTIKALDAAENMRLKFPNSKVVHLALYKFYLDAGKLDAAVKSMKLVLKAEEIDVTSKLKVLNDFLVFVEKHPQYEDELKEVASLFSEKENTPGVFKKLGEYYLAKNDKIKALSYFQLGIQEDSNDFELYKNTISLQIALEKYEKAVATSKNALEIFPVQSVLYFLKGKALNNLGRFKEAEEILTFGLDYLPEEGEMASNFYSQLIIATKALGNTKKIAEFEQKQRELIKNEN